MFEPQLDGGLERINRNLIREPQRVRAPHLTNGLACLAEPTKFIGLPACAQRRSNPDHRVRILVGDAQPFAVGDFTLGELRRQGSRLPAKVRLPRVDGRQLIGDLAEQTEPTRAEQPPLRRNRKPECQVSHVSSRRAPVLERGAEELDVSSRLSLESVGQSSMQPAGLLFRDGLVDGVPNEIVDHLDGASRLRRQAAVEEPADGRLQVRYRPIEESGEIGWHQGPRSHCQRGEHRTPVGINQAKPLRHGVLRPSPLLASVCQDLEPEWRTAGCLPEPVGAFLVEVWGELLCERDGIVLQERPEFDCPEDGDVPRDRPHRVAQNAHGGARPRRGQENDGTVSCRSCTDQVMTQRNGQFVRPLQVVQDDDRREPLAHCDMGGLEQADRIEPRPIGRYNGGTGRAAARHARGQHPKQVARRGQRDAALGLVASYPEGVAKRESRRALAQEAALTQASRADDHDGLRLPGMDRGPCSLKNDLELGLPTDELNGHIRSVVPASLGVNKRPSASWRRVAAKCWPPCCGRYREGSIVTSASSIFASVLVV